MWAIILYAFIQIRKKCLFTETSSLLNCGYCFVENKDKTKEIIKLSKV